MVTLVIVKNPFSPQDGREVKYIEAEGTLADLLEEYKMPGVDLQATVNGYAVDDKEIKDEDFIVIYPVIEKGGKGGKGILGIVAAIALSVVSFGVGGLAGAGAWGASMTTWGTMGYIAAAAVMFLGSSLLGRLMGQKADVGQYDSQNESTYSWSGVQTMEGQNNAISLTYGKVKSGGQTIGKYVSSVNDDDYLNWLIACGEGELSITNIELNDNPIGNYSGVSYTTRSGTNDQSVIPYFNDTYFTKNVSYHMTQKNHWYTDTAQGSATEGLIVKIELPNGLFHGTDEGKQATNEVDVVAQYKPTNSSDWTPIAAITIKGKSTKAIRKELRVDHIPAGEYDVRVLVERIKNEDATRDVWDVYWTGVTSVVYDDLCYPCQALIGIKAKATDQLNGSPSLTFIKERASVWVYSTVSNQYEQKSASNPAWACYDLLHQARRLKNIRTNQYQFEVRGAAKELMRYEDFLEWADWCDTKRYYVNIEINTVGEALEVANEKLAPIGHGLVVRYGTRYGCIYDHVQTPVQMFGMGNILAGTFSEEFMKVSDRANCVEITFTNKDAGYERDVLTIYGDTYNTDGYAKTAQMTFDGIVDYTQAYREGMYQLYSNRYLLRNVSFEVGIDAIACTVGDVVMVSHDVPMWANSGRIDSVNGRTWVLPVQLQDLSQSYRIQWRSAKDNLYTRSCTIVSSADGWTTITVQGTIPDDDPPQAGDVFDIAIANVGSKPFVVKSITRAQDFTRRVSCIEYNENIYNENYDIPVINYSQWHGEPKNVTGLVAKLSQQKNSFGADIGRMQCSWNIPDNGGKFTVLLSTDGGTTWAVGRSGIYSNSCVLDVQPNTTYWVKVITFLDVNQSSGVVAGPLYPNGDDNLPMVTNLKGNTRYRSVKDGEYRYEIHLTWTPPKLSNYAGCNIWYKTNHVQGSDMMVVEGVSADQLGFQNNWKYAGDGYADFTLNDVVFGDTYRFAVATKDSLGNSNDQYNAPTIDVIATAKTTTPNVPDDFRIAFGKEAICSWKEVTNADIQFYEVRNDANPGKETKYLLGRTTGLKASVALSQRRGQLWLYARNPMGKYSYPAILEYYKPAPQQPHPPKLKALIGGFSVTTDEIPVDCSGIDVYINGSTGNTVIHSENASITHSCDPGIYDVKYCFTDFFGRGTWSAEERVTVLVYIDPALIQAESLSLEKMDSTIQEAVADAQASVGELLQVKSDITDLQVADGNITATVASNKAEQDSKNTALTQDISQLQVKSDNISSMVVQNKIMQDGTNQTMLSRINQNAASVTSIVGNLNDTTKAIENYSAISQMSSNIELRVKNNEVVSKINMSPETIKIDGKYIHITGNTVIDNNLITRGMIQAGAVTADKMSVTSLSAICATIGTLRTASSGARLEVTSSVIRVYDSNNVLRVRLGVW